MITIRPSMLLQKRWLLLLGAVILVHLAAIEWAFSLFQMPMASERGQDVLMADLRPASIPAAVEAQSPAPEAEAVLQKSQPTRKSETVRPSAPKPLPTVESIASSLESPAQGVPPTPMAIETRRNQRGLPIYPITRAHSASLKYVAQSVRSGQSTSGSGVLRWESGRRNFTIQGEVVIGDAPALKFRSEGVIDEEHGIAPVLYAEQRNKRAETNTHFHRERNEVSFSASTETYPIVGGEQDRASIIWQMVGIARQDGEKLFMPGLTIPMFVAGVREAEVWQIRIADLEEIDTPMGKLQAWHLVRLPPEGSYQQRLDFWLAPGKDWYPVKIRYTNANGDVLDLSVSELRLIPET